MLHFVGDSLEEKSCNVFCITNMCCSLCGSAVEGLEVLLQSAAFSRFLLSLVPKLLLLQSGLGWLQSCIHLRWRQDSNISFILYIYTYTHTTILRIYVNSNIFFFFFFSILIAI